MPAAFNIDVPGIPLPDDDPIAQVISDLGIVCQYRQAFVASAAAPVGGLTAGTTVRRPVGTHDAQWDPVEDVADDSTVDAGTDYAGGYAPAVRVTVYFAAPPTLDLAAIGLYGLSIQGRQDVAYLLSREIVPSRGDLIIHPDGERYVVGEEQRAIGTTDRPVAYRVSVEHRKAGSPVYQA